MESGWFLRAVLVLSWLSLFKAQNTPGTGVFCLRSIPADGHSLLTFLRHDAAGVRFLYLTKWSEDMRLAACEINSNPDVTEEYHAFCNIKETWDQELVEKFKIGLLLSPDSPCALVPSGVPESSGGSGKGETERKTRRKRSWIFPGTLWCGTGTKAAGFEQLGMFEKADKCCREHDHCSDIIPAFTVNYGVFNPNFFTVSHCECDQRFRQCLLGTNDSISSVVGYSFFNILKVPCFELKQQKHCTQMYWWGMCKNASEAPYAIFKSPLPYNSSDVTSKYDNNNLTISKEQHLFERPVSNPEGKASESKHRCRLRDPPGGDTFHSRRTKGSQQPLGHTTPLMIHANNSLVKNDMTDNEVRCRSLKHLDDCKYKIPPLEKKYNLTNMESKTAYHCDCTSRLAVWIKSLKEPSPPHSLMVEFVSQDCFTLSKEKKCNRTKRCSGGFTKASDLHQALKKIKEKDSAAMRFSASGGKKRIPVRLYKYCLRLQMRADIMAQLK
ncbi:hypothetical protein CHARACLAT_002449 [Characodon lateralis]|uniref:Phospholipase A2-like central domain-containing protein n=1 Tax=Characodon lateralis TaxID=208331 RepID=A0ABU7CM77_9TELE|nr:hypothetical protein [Characodon lateralis]